MNAGYQLFLLCTLNAVGKGENASYQLFLLCPQCFQSLSYLEPLDAVGKGENAELVLDTAPAFDVLSGIL